MCVSRFSQGVYKEVVYKAFTICVLQGFYNVFDTSFTMFVYEVFTMSFAGALQDCYNALEGISKDFKLFLEGLYEDFRRLLQVVCPTGLRGWAQVPLAQAAWAQVPQLSLWNPRLRSKLRNPSSASRI